MMMQKMAGCLICFGKLAPFESTDIIYHSKLLFHHVEGALVVTIL